MDEKLQRRLSEDVRRLLVDDTFKEILQLLAKRMNSLDTVRGIKIDTPVMEVGTRQLANFLAIETIEMWLDDILAIKNFSLFSQEAADEEDNIFKRLIEKDDVPES